MNTISLKSAARNFRISSMMTPSNRAEKNMPSFCRLLTVRLSPHTSLCLTKTAIFSTFQRNATQTDVPQRLMFPTRQHLCSLYITLSLSKVCCVLFTNLHKAICGNLISLRTMWVSILFSTVRFMPTTRKISRSGKCLLKNAVIC